MFSLCLFFIWCPWRKTKLMPALCCARLMWSTVLRSGDRPGCSNVPHSISEHWQTWKSRLMFWPESLPFVHPELRSPAFSDVGFQWIRPWKHSSTVPPLHLSSVWFSPLLIYIWPLRFHPGKTCLCFRDKCDLTITTIELKIIVSLQQNHILITDWKT